MLAVWNYFTGKGKTPLLNLKNLTGAVSWKQWWEGEPTWDRGHLLPLTWKSSGDTRPFWDGISTPCRWDRYSFLKVISFIWFDGWNSTLNRTPAQGPSVTLKPEVRSRCCYFFGAPQRLPVPGGGKNSNTEHRFPMGGKVLVLNAVSQCYHSPLARVFSVESFE